MIPINFKNYKYFLIVCLFIMIIMFDEIGHIASIERMTTTMSQHTPLELIIRKFFS